LQAFNSMAWAIFSEEANPREWTVACAAS